MFYSDEVRAGRAWVRGDTAEHLRRVLRVEEGQQFELSDRQNIYLASVAGFAKGAVEFELIKPLEARQLGATIAIFAGLIKFDRFEWIIEKCSELGVSQVTPVVASRSDQGLDKAAQKRQERWARICLESGQQSRRLAPMGVGACTKFKDAIAMDANVGERLFLDEAGGSPLLNCLSAAFDRAAILTGPEGGWTDQERADALACGWKPATLGENILRAETAAIAATSSVQSKWWSNAGS